MARRVSIKGKGADIFFGDYTAGRDQPSTAPTPPETRRDLPSGAVPPASDAKEATKPATFQASKQEGGASTQEKKEGGKQAEKQARRPGLAPGSGEEQPGYVLDARFVDALDEELREQATITNSFRYTDQELELLGDVLYELGKRHGGTFSKQDIARLGLVLLLRDFRRQGAESLLAQLAKRRRRGGRGDR